MLSRALLRWQVLRELQQAERGRADVEAEVDAAREESETSLAALTSEHGTAMS